METVLIVLIVLLALALPVGYLISKWREKKQLEEVERSRREIPGIVPPASTYEDRVPAHLRNYSNANYARSATAYHPSTTVVQQDSGFNPLLAGAIGYMIGSSGSNHHHHDNPAPAIGSCPAERDSDSSSDSGSSYSSSDSGSSSSSDSGSSYDSGSSSSDSGGSSGGGGGD